MAHGLDRQERMFDRLFNLVLEILFYATGASVLHLFGYKDHDDFAAWLTGFALWALAILAIFVLAGF
jgi:hypothetical protein